MKRGSDILLASLGCVLILPLLIIIALLIKLDEPKGTIIFKQIRIGKDEREFHMYKFRSMIFDADDKLNELLEQNEIKGAMFKMKDDPRVTKVGKFIRKTSIDELPQLWNVIKGNMSLVGPRPPLPREVEQYSDNDKKRLLIKPGCTGLWQVSGRNNLSFFQMVQLDMEYMEKQSLFFDFKIMIKTLKYFLGSNDAH
jgi:lipopolysaccharide/colanic/teichoic acid biosynthesis glycosyltransferase